MKYKLFTAQAGRLPPPKQPSTCLTSGTDWERRRSQPWRGTRTKRAFWPSEQTKEEWAMSIAFLQGKLFFSTHFPRLRRKLSHLSYDMILVLQKHFILAGRTRCSVNSAIGRPSILFVGVRPSLIRPMISPARMRRIWKRWKPRNVIPIYFYKTFHWSFSMMAFEMAILAHFPHVSGLV